MTMLAVLSLALYVGGLVLDHWWLSLIGVALFVVTLYRRLDRPRRLR